MTALSSLTITFEDYVNEEYTFLADRDPGQTLDIPSLTFLSIIQFTNCQDPVALFLSTLKADNLRRLLVSLQSYCHGRDGLGDDSGDEDDDDHRPWRGKLRHFPSLSLIEFDGHCTVLLQDLIHGFSNIKLVALKVMMPPIGERLSRIYFEELDGAARWLEENTSLEWCGSAAGRWAPIENYFSSWSEVRLHFQGGVIET